MAKDQKLAEIEDWLDNLDPAEDEAKDGRNMRRISAAVEEVESAELELRKAVADARRAGDSWAMIGTALGISRQAANQRFGDVVADKPRKRGAARKVPPARKAEQRHFAIAAKKAGAAKKAAGRKPSGRTSPSVTGSGKKS